MGKYLDAVVVEDERTARECVQYLKEQRVGTCTFLPLDSIKVKPIDEKLRATSGIKLVLDLLKFEPFLHNAVLFAVGNTLVAEDIKEARRLAFDQVIFFFFFFDTIKINIPLGRKKQSSYHQGSVDSKIRSHLWWFWRW
jgi:hypothetical protein